MLNTSLLNFTLIFNIQNTGYNIFMTNNKVPNPTDASAKSDWHQLTILCFLDKKR